MVAFDHRQLGKIPLSVSPRIPGIDSGRQNNFFSYQLARDQADNLDFRTLDCNFETCFAKFRNRYRISGQRYLRRSKISFGKRFAGQKNLRNRKRFQIIK